MLLVQQQLDRPNYGYLEKAVDHGRVMQDKYFLQTSIFLDRFIDAYGRRFEAEYGCDGKRRS